MLDYTEKIDTSGMNCPLPILRAKKKLSELQNGDVLYVICTDTVSVMDFDAFCKQSGNLLLESSEADGKYHHFIRKA